MDVKKSPKVSLEDKRFVYLLMGFIVALTLVYIGFEWTEKEITVYEDIDTEFHFEEELDIIQTSQDVPPPPPPPPAPQVVEVLNVVEDTQEVETIEISSEEDLTEVIEIAAPVVQIEEEEEEVIFQVVEKMPEFPGGNEALMRFLSNNIRYPAIAQENGIQGRVICQFVVNRDGTIVDVEVVRSIDPSLDREAIRVIKAMPKWRPGEQRGKTVRVKYTLPVNFRLQ